MTCGRSPLRVGASRLGRPEGHTQCTATRSWARARATALAFSDCSSSWWRDGPALLQLGRGGRRVDLGGGDRGVRQDGDDVVADLREAAVDEVAIDVCNVPGPGARRSRAGRSAGSGRAGCRLRRRTTAARRTRPRVEQRPFRRDDHALDPAVRLALPAFSASTVLGVAIASPAPGGKSTGQAVARRRPSSWPALRPDRSRRRRGTPSGRWSHLPSQISWKLRMVSARGVYCPALSREDLATKNGSEGAARSDRRDPRRSCPPRRLVDAEDRDDVAELLAVRWRIARRGGRRLPVPGRCWASRMRHVSQQVDGRIRSLSAMSAERGEGVEEGRNVVAGPGRSGRRPARRPPAPR